ncbi:hypothetical protein GCM10028778_18990 [Barrientosiimonas marina]|uniref:Phage protein n=1 Tax=Lentibacillus kimchii TaxID=1542911 RepID=A0ABW2UUD8_9BACI
MSQILIEGYEISEAFAKQYKEVREFIENNRYGQQYEVTIQFNHNLSEDTILEWMSFVDGGWNKETYEYKYYYDIPDPEDGVFLIDMDLFYLLEDSEYGTYTWKCLSINFPWVNEEMYKISGIDI